MNVYKMSVDELRAAVGKVSSLAVEIGAEYPEAAAVMMDGAKLALDEILVHLCKGDRKMAAKMSRHLDVGDH